MKFSDTSNNSVTPYVSALKLRKYAQQAKEEEFVLRQARNSAAKDQISKFVTSRLVLICRSRHNAQVQDQTVAPPKHARDRSMICIDFVGCGTINHDS